MDYCEKFVSQIEALAACQVLEDEHEDSAKLLCPFCASYPKREEDGHG